MDPVSVLCNVTSMDRDAILNTVASWIAEVGAADPHLAWLGDAELTAEPAFLVDTKTKEGDDYKAGAVRIAVTPEAGVDAASIERLHDAIVADRTLRSRAKLVIFESPRNDAEAGILVVIPR